MDVFWKGYYTFRDLEERWGKTREQINAVIMGKKLIPSYFLRPRDAREVTFKKSPPGSPEHLVVDENFLNEYVGRIFVFLRNPVRTSLTEYVFYYGCESPTAPMEEMPFDSWYEFDVEINSNNNEIIFLQSQVEKFEKTYLPDASPNGSVAPTLYPWGDHNTHLLTKLSEAATALWSRYDPLDPSTAPTNEQVTDWLTERGVPKRTAETMATMLRADGLKMGRRKY